MKCQCGDVVLVSYPFASGGGAKTRPALVVQCDSNNQRLDNTLVVQITSRIRFATSEPTQLLLKVASPAGQQAGLLNDSAVSCENVFTVRQDAIIRRIGLLPPDVMQQVDECLKSSLGLS